MAKRYLTDTNTIIDYLENKLPKIASLIIDNIDIQLSVISRIELLVWQEAFEDQIRILKDFISASFVFNLSEDIILETIEIRKNYRIKLPDAIIAATGVVNDLTFITRNSSDFEKIVHLKQIDPHHL